MTLLSVSWKTNYFFSLSSNPFSLNFFTIVSNNKGQVSLEQVLVIRLNDENTALYNEILNEISRDSASTNDIRIFEFEHVRYIFNYHIDLFVRMRQLDEISTTNQLIHTSLNCVSDEQRNAL